MAGAPRKLAIIGDVFCDLSAVGITGGLPEWGGDRAVDAPIQVRSRPIAVC